MKEKFIGKRRKGLAELRQKAFEVLRGEKTTDDATANAAICCGQ